LSAQFLIGNTSAVQSGAVVGVAGLVSFNFSYPCRWPYAVSGAVYVNTPEIPRLTVSVVGTVACNMSLPGPLVTLNGTIASFSWLGNVFQNTSLGFVYRRDGNVSNTFFDASVSGILSMSAGSNWYNVSATLVETVPIVSGVPGDSTLKSAKIGLSFGSNPDVLKASNFTAGTCFYQNVTFKNVTLVNGTIQRNVVATNVTYNASCPVPQGWALSLTADYAAKPVCTQSQVAGLGNGSVPLAGLLAMNLPSYGLQLRAGLNGTMACNVSAVGIAYQLKGTILSLAYNGWTVQGVGVTFERGTCELSRLTAAEEPWRAVAAAVAAADASCLSHAASQGM